MSSVTTTDGTGGSLFSEEDGADLLKELGVDVLSLGGLVAGGDGLVAAAAAESAGETAVSAAGWPVVVVAARGFTAGTRHQREGYAKYSVM